jgi:hypothetical protein
MIVYKRRRNPSRKSKARKSKRVSRRRVSRGKKHRITAYKKKGRWTVHRKRSRLFRRSKSRSIRIRNPFRIPKLGGFVPSKTFAMSAIGVVAGYAVGNKAMTYFEKIPGLTAESLVKNPKAVVVVKGVLNVIIGSLVAGKMKGELLKGVGIGIAASGTRTALLAAFPTLKEYLGVDLSSDGMPPGLAYGNVGEEMTRVGDEMVRVGVDLSASDESVYEQI